MSELKTNGDWKSVEDFPKFGKALKGFYVNSQGDAKKVEEDGSEHEIFWNNANGYKTLITHVDGKMKTVYAHRLVAWAFISNPNNLPYVNHKNGIRDDNRVENLEWTNASGNARHCWSKLHTYPKGVHKKQPKYRIVKKPNDFMYYPEYWDSALQRYEDFWKLSCGVNVRWAFFTKRGAIRAIKKIKCHIAEKEKGDQIVWTSKE